MQSFFSTWAISVTVAVLFSAMVNALLPDTSIRKYIKVVLGIVVTIIMLSPLFKLVGGVDLSSEVSNTLEQLRDVSEYEYDSAEYKDYIFEVYMGDR